MPNVEEILGAPPGVDELLGPRPASRAELQRSAADAGAAAWQTHDDALDRAARDWQAQLNAPSMDEMIRRGIIKPGAPPERPPKFEPENPITATAGELGSVGTPSPTSPEDSFRTTVPPIKKVSADDVRRSEGFGYDLNDPIVPLGDLLLREPRSQSEGGINDSLRPTLNSLTTPKNLGLIAASMGVSATGQTAAKIVAALWASWMGKDAVQNAPEIGAELGREFAKPEEERDQRKIAQLLTQGGVDAAFTALPAAHVATGEIGAVDVAKQFDEAVRSAQLPDARDILPERRPVTRIEQPGESSEGPHRIVLAEDLLGQLFPKRELTREEARGLRDQAWKEQPEVRSQRSEVSEEVPQAKDLPAGKVVSPTAERQPVVAAEPAGATRTGQPELPQTEPPRGGNNPVERAESARPWDLIDELEGNIGGLSLESAKKLDPNWSPRGAARKLFQAGGQGIDQAAEAIRRSGVAKLAKDEDLLYELDKAAEARKTWRKDFYQGEQTAQEQGRGQERFEKDAAKFKRPHEAIVADELMPGDEFELQGEKVKVQHLDFDEHGDVSHVTLQDGPKYGTVQVPGGTVIRMDPKTWDKTEGEPEDWKPQGTAESRVLPPSSSQAAVEKTRPGETGEAVLREEAPKTTKPPTLEESRAAAESRATERTLRTQEQQRNGTGEAARQLERTQPPAKQKWFLGLRKMFAPATIDDAARTMAGIIRHALGKEYESMRQADFQLKTFQREFDRTPVGRNWAYDAVAPLPRNYQVMRAIDTGQVGNLTPAERSFAQVMRRQLDEAIEQVQAVSPNSLRELIENYFPRIWAEQEKHANAISQLLSKRPWEGPKSFLKKRVLEYFTDGLEMGLRPVSDNPVDVTLLKLGEMYRFAATRAALEEAKARGLRRFVYIYEQTPEAWREVQDPSSTLYAPPVVTIKEAYDAQMRAKTLEMLQQLGVPHQRLANIGGQRWGFAQPASAFSGAPGKIVTKFAGPDSVIWHEMGHQMDWRYPELRRLLGANSPGSKVGKQLAALADLRAEGATDVTRAHRKYLRSAEEQMANVFEAYLQAPEKFRQTAPDVWHAFEGWLEQHPEVKNPLREIRPSLRLAEGESELFLGGPVKLGRWMMPEGAAQVADNYLTPGLGRFKTFRSLREVSGLLNGVQLLGFFHGQFVENDSFYSGIGLALYDVLQGKPGRALKEAAQIPISPFTSLYRGHKIKGAIENPAAATAEYRQLAKLAVEQNLRAGHGNFDPEFSRRWARAFHEVLHEPSAGAVWETFWRAPMAATQLAMKPVMDLLVPRMKLGIYARMASRVMEDHANADAETLRRKLAEAADATEDRLGQVTYDNLFQNRAVKDAGQLAMRAYGWQLTKYRMIFGGSADWTRAAAALVKGQKPEITFRMTYLPAMVMGHAILGGMLGYALTGKRPEKLLDYLFPQSGMVDAHGNPVRLSIADFVKDVIADVHGVMSGRPLEEWSRKLAPFWNMAAEMYRNEDFWNTRIFSERQLGEPGLEHLLKNLKEGAGYLGKTALPFSVTAGQRMAQTARDPKVAAVAPFFGVVPAPRYATQTRAEARAAEIMRDMSPRGARSPEQAKHAQTVANLVQDIRLGKINNEGDFERAARTANVKDKAELTRIKERVLWTPLQYQVYRMPIDKAMEVFDLANEQERLSLAQSLAEKIQRAFDGGKLDTQTAQRYVKLVQPWYRQSRQRPPDRKSVYAR